jgi:hypothetical protein
VPLLASIPVLGHLFRFDSEVQQKTELLIILTPRVIWDQEDAELIKQVESARISWVLSDVRKIHGVEGLRTRWESLDCKDIPVIYPDQDPRGVMIEEMTEEVPPPDDKAPAPAPMPPPKATFGPNGQGAPGAAPGGYGPMQPTPPQRSLMHRPPVDLPQGASRPVQPPSGPVRQPSEAGPAIQAPSTTSTRPPNTAIPGARPVPAPPPGTMARIPAPAYGLPPGGVQPAAYQATYQPAPAVPARLPANSPAPVSGDRAWPPPPLPQAPLPVTGTPPQNPAPPRDQPQAQQTAQYRPWGQP